MDNRSSTLRQVLQVTEALTAEIGCQNITLQEIIRRSGISKGAIYHYVQSKDELFGLILQQHMERKVENHKNKASISGHPGLAVGHPSMGHPQPHPHGSASTGSPTASPSFSPAYRKLGPLAVIVLGLLQPADDQQLVLRRCFIYLLSRQEQPDVAKIVADLHQNWIDFVAEWAKACQSAGIIPSTIHPENTASLIISVLFGLMVQKSIMENQAQSAAPSVDMTAVLHMFSSLLGMEA